MSARNPPAPDPAVLMLAQGRLGLGVKAAIFDVDGVLTDGRLFIGEAGEIFKAFHVLDGQGLKLLLQAGIEPIIITGRDGAAVRRRVTDLGLRHAAYGASDKLAVANELLKALKLSWDEVAAIGDDWPDLPVLANRSLCMRPTGFAPRGVGACAPRHPQRWRQGGSARVL